MASLVRTCALTLAAAIPAICSQSIATSGPTESPPPPPKVTITLSSHRFMPGPILLTAGQPVRLVFRNDAGKGHDFTARQFFAASRILAGTAPNGRVDLAAGQTRTIDLVPAKGTYNVHCSKFMHATMGMRTQVIVR